MLSQTYEGYGVYLKIVACKDSDHAFLLGIEFAQVKGEIIKLTNNQHNNNSVIPSPFSSQNNSQLPTVQDTATNNEQIIAHEQHLAELTERKLNMKDNQKFSIWTTTNSSSSATLEQSHVTSELAAQASTSPHSKMTETSDAPKIR